VRTVCTEDDVQLQDDMTKIILARRKEQKHRRRAKIVFAWFAWAAVVLVIIILSRGHEPARPTQPVAERFPAANEPMPKSELDFDKLFGRRRPATRILVKSATLEQKSVPVVKQPRRDSIPIYYNSNSAYVDVELAGINRMILDLWPGSLAWSVQSVISRWIKGRHILHPDRRDTHRQSHTTRCYSHVFKT
jgi:hypothetical protein